MPRHKVASFSVSTLAISVASTASSRQARNRTQASLSLDSNDTASANRCAVYSS